MSITTIFSHSSLSSVSNTAKIMKNREYLISDSIANDINSYIGFDPFYTFEDSVHDHDYDKETGKDSASDSKTVDSPIGVRSIFNKSAAVLVGGGGTENISTEASGWRIGLNVPLMDSAETRTKMREDLACTVKDLVSASKNGLLGQETYDWSDFMYCKYLGRLPNTYMITLRRFPIPVGDYIGSSWYGTERGNDGMHADNPVSTGCMVTWLGTPGNDINNILKYSYNMPFTEETARWEEDTTNADSQTGILNQVASVFDKQYMSDFAAGYGGANASALFNKIFKANITTAGPYSLGEIKNFRDSRKVYGPVDAIKDTYRRSDAGLKFNQSFSLQFDYEMRSYNGINQRQAFLDLIANILTVTYSTGEFWGGAYWNRNGMHQNNLFTNLPLFSSTGPMTFTGYVEKFADSLTTVSNTLKSQFIVDGKLTLKNAFNFLKSFLNTAAGGLIGGYLNKLGRPQKVMLNSLLSPAPVGFWHVTIGNPKAPIMSIGNMIIENAEISHYGPFGIDDFPTGLKVTVSLKRGKGRDSRDIEMLYMGGNARIYSPMGPATFDIYNNAKTYKNSIGTSETAITPNAESNSASTINITDTLKRTFGTANTSSILIQAKEQEWGAYPKQNSDTTLANS